MYALPVAKRYKKLIINLAHSRVLRYVLYHVSCGRTKYIYRKFREDTYLFSIPSIGAQGDNKSKVLGTVCKLSTAYAQAINHRLNSLALPLIGGVHIGAGALLDINLKWFAIPYHSPIPVGRRGVYCLFK